MGQGHPDKSQNTEVRTFRSKGVDVGIEDFVLEKGIFNKVFKKDIRRVFIYKKAERLAKAIHLVGPALVGSMSLKNRIDGVAIGLVDAAILTPGVARATLSHELLALSSLLSIARTGGLLSPMNADLILREAHTLLQEVAAYEEPRLAFDEAPTLADIAKSAPPQISGKSALPRASQGKSRQAPRVSKGHIKDRKDAILSVIEKKGKASIKDISTLIRTVSEKTIQRELQALTTAGILKREGERRWSTYSLV